MSSLARPCREPVQIRNKGKEGLYPSNYLDFAAQELPEEEFDTLSTSFSHTVLSDSARSRKTGTSLLDASLCSTALNPRRLRKTALLFCSWWCLFALLPLPLPESPTSLSLSQFAP